MPVSSRLDSIELGERVVWEIGIVRRTMRVYVFQLDFPFEMEFDMKKPYLVLTLAVLLAIGGMTLAQQQQRPLPSIELVPTPPPPKEIPTPQVVPLTVSPKPEPAPQRYPVSLPAPKMEELSIDQLLDTIEALRAQKAELEKKEQTILKLIEKKVEKQQERIDRLNIVEQASLSDHPLPSTTLPSSN